MKNMIQTAHKIHPHSICIWHPSTSQWRWRWLNPPFTPPQPSIHSCQSMFLPPLPLTLLSSHCQSDSCIHQTCHTFLSLIIGDTDYNHSDMQIPHLHHHQIQSDIITKCTQTSPPAMYISLLPPPNPGFSVPKVLVHTSRYVFLVMCYVIYQLQHFPSVLTSQDEWWTTANSLPVQCGVLLWLIRLWWKQGPIR